jgi:NAD(P)H dehydrogenase (quinone)
MKIYVVFAHPSTESFTREVLDEFSRGLQDAGHSIEIGDLYQKDFKTDMDLEQYTRETGTDSDAPLPPDVRHEHAKINAADMLAFIYPVWWSDCPAKLKGWFDRVLTFGYAYTYEGGEHSTSKIEIQKALVICPAGHPVDYLEETGIAESMRRVMLNDRLLGVGVKEARMEILGGMMHNDPDIREQNLETAYQLGRNF